MYSVDENSLAEEVVEEHPEGGDRGGYQIVTHTVSVEGDTLAYELENSDCHESFDEPDPVCNNREEALSFLEFSLSMLRKQTAAAEVLLKKAKATTKFTTNYVVPDEEEDED